MSSIVVPYSTDRDSIIVSELSTKATFTSGDRWSKPRPQPITISLYLETALAEAGASDDVAHTVNYGTLTKEIERLAGEREYGGLRDLADILVLLCWTHPRSEAARVDIIAPNVFLRADALGVTLFRERNGQRIGIDQMWIKSLRAACIIGVNEPERVYKQNVEVDVTFDDPGWIVPDWRKMHDTLINTLEVSTFLTLEALATALAKVACHLPGAHKVTIQARKPSALVNAKSSGVEITRTREFWQ